MRKLLIPVLLFYSLTYGQSATVDIPITAVNETYTRALRLGLDSTATDGIDESLGEFEIPPVPPGTFPFDIRFDLSIVGYTATTWKDYRHAVFPFTGTVQHKMRWQLANGSGPLILNYELPLGAVMFIEDPFGGLQYNIGPLIGSGSCSLARNYFPQAIVTINYTNVPFGSTQPFLMLNPSALNFGTVVVGNSLTLPASISNAGNASLVISDISSTNPHFIIYHAPLPITLAPGANSGMTVTFTPTGENTQSGTILFTSNNFGSPLVYLVGGSGDLQPAISNSIYINDQHGGTHLLFFGLDPLATDSLDVEFDEAILPPVPPQGAFDTRLYLPLDNFLGSISSYTDIRPMPSVPFTGQKEFRIAYQISTGSPGAKISWNFPGYMTGILQDLFGGIIVNVPMSGIGDVVINPTVDKLKMLINYNNVVPVELTSFNANVNDDNVLLNWQTASEKNNKGFDVERKCINTSWEKIAFIEGTGTSTTKHFYSYADNNRPWGFYTYRLKQIDYDGGFTYSKEINAEVVKLNEYILNQNYPNPFNPTTVITYTIPITGLITLKVYNVFGEEASVLVNEIKEPGKYSVQFNAKELASGVYLYKVTSANYTETKKMLLIK